MAEDAGRAEAGDASGSSKTGEGAGMSEGGERTEGVLDASPRTTRIQAVRRSTRPSKFWLLPLAALLVGGLLLVKMRMEQGPRIVVSFAGASGMEAGKTKVRYRDVDVGSVESIHLSEDGSKVLATIALAKESARFEASDTRFWVVRPRLGGSGISGLETIMSGVYVGASPGRSDVPSQEFKALEAPPAAVSDEAGTRFRLRAEDIGSLDIGSPVLFRRIEVGKVEDYRLDGDGRGISLEIFVKSPYDRLVSPQAAFWHASGVDFNLDANGVKVDVQSLATLLNGGVSFETPSDRTVQEPAKAGETFRLAQTKAEAFKSPDAEGARLSMRFHQSVRGLVEGAPVDLRGIPVGRVVSIHLEEDASSREIDPVVSVEVYPKRIADSGAGTLEGILARGARAQLRTGSLLTGQLYVALDFFQGAPFQVGPGAEADGVRIVGTVPSDLEDLSRHARSVMAKIDAIPFEGLGQDARRTLSSLDSVLKRMDSAVGRTDKTVLPELAGALKDLRSTMEGLKAVADPDAPLQQDAREAIRGLSEAARSLKALGDEIEQRPESLLRGRAGN